MSEPITRSELIEALQSARQAHHQYETARLKGKRDPNWAGWYAAYLLGRLGDFVPPSQLTCWLEEAPASENWAAAAADSILQNKTGG